MLSVVPIYKHIQSNFLQYKRGRPNSNEFHFHSQIPHSTVQVYEQSQFIDYSLRVLNDLLSVSLKLSNLQSLIQKSGKLTKQQGTINKEFISLKELLKETEKKIRKCLVIEVDIKGANKKTRQKFKQQVNMTLECKFIECSLQYKGLYETKVEMQTKVKSFYGYNQSFFLQATADQKAMMQRKQEYKEIQSGIVEISQTYKNMVSMVKMQSYMVQRIGQNTDCTYDNVVQGRRNLSEVNQREKKNRQFIIKVFVVMYVFVFIYINILL